MDFSSPARHPLLNHQCVGSNLAVTEREIILIYTRLSANTRRWNNWPVRGLVRISAIVSFVGQYTILKLNNAICCWMKAYLMNWCFDLVKWFGPLEIRIVDILSWWMGLERNLPRKIMGVQEINLWSISHTSLLLSVHQLQLLLNWV